MMDVLGCTIECLQGRAALTFKLNGINLYLTPDGLTIRLAEKHVRDSRGRQREGA